MTIIIIDSREVALIEACVTQKLGLTIEIETLPLGDIQIGTSWLIERKTVADFAASIIDGRFEEQRARLRSVDPSIKVGYLIEGSVSSVYLKGGLIAAITSVGMEFRLFMSDSPQSSAHVLAKIARGQKEVQSQKDCAELQAVKIHKTKISDPQSMLKVTLMNIPRIGPKTAEQICTKFDSIVDFVLNVSRADKKYANVLKLFGFDITSPSLSIPNK